MNRDNDMAHVKGPFQYRFDAEHGMVDGVYGDTVGGRSFTDPESAALEVREKELRPHLAVGWRSVWAGPGMSHWTIIVCLPETEAEIRPETEAEITEWAEIEAEIEASDRA